MDEGNNIVSQSKLKTGYICLQEMAPRPILSRTDGSYRQETGFQKKILTSGKSSSGAQSYAEIIATSAFVACLLRAPIKELACERLARLPFAALTGTLGVRPCAGKNKVPSRCTPHISI